MRAAVRPVTVAVTALLLVAGPGGWTAAQAHPGDPGDPEVSAEEHARQDLVGTSIEQVERDTAARAAALRKRTGRTPGRRPTRASEQTSAVERLSRAAAAAPSNGGRWGAVVDTPVVPVFQAVLPSGKVLVWDSVGEGPAESTGDHTFTRAMLWDPTGDRAERVDVQGYNIFCAGFVQLANGNVLVAGGNANAALDGIQQTHLFDWQTETWSRGPDMAAGRWYPSVAALENGEAVIVAGGPATAEVFSTDRSLRPLSGFASFADRLYPFLVPRRDGQVELVGPGPMSTMRTTGAGAVTATRERDGLFRDYGSFATYDVGRTLVAGGGRTTEDGRADVATRTAVVVGTDGGSTVTPTGSMAVARRQHDLTVLADGSVLATGGQQANGDDLVDLDDAVFAAERWDPEDGTWTVLDSAARVREYHSSATLLPDGRVMKGGGGVCGTCTAQGYLEKNVEYFSPPYLFDADGTPAARPVVSSAPATATYGRPLVLTSPQAGRIAEVGLVRLGATTHGADQGQRYVPLDFTADGTTVTATAPADGGVAPPGYYMLFVVDEAGVPSEAEMVRVQPASTQLRTAGGQCVDVTDGNPADRTPLQTWSCWGGPQQRWAPEESDQSLRSTGGCMDIADGTLTSGTRVQLFGCNGTPAQQWDWRADGTVRPVAARGLCLSVVDGASADGARLEVRTCSGAADQRWTW